VSADASVSRWLIVVRRNKPDLHRDLTRAFERVPQMAVLLDRRVVGGHRESPAEQRRTPLTFAELELWETVGFRLIPPAILVFQNPATR
jgi:hypothetical protein